jgi:hypothetical protein
MAEQRSAETNAALIVEQRRIKLATLVSGLITTLRVPQCLSRLTPDASEEQLLCQW